MALPEPTPEALLPVYTCDVNRPVTLYEGPAILSGDDGEAHGECTLRYVWMPSDGLEVEFRGGLLDLESERQLQVHALGLTAKVVGRRSYAHIGERLFIGLASGKVAFGKPDQLARLKFHVANFPKVFGEIVRRGTCEMRARLQFESPPWRITLDPAPDERAFGEPDLPSRISEQRGFGITHVGEITRIDSAEFSAADAEPLLSDLGRTLSFARASFSTPLLRVGFDRAGNASWQDWSSYRVEAWRSAHESWFSKLRPNILQSVFAGWQRLAAHPNAEVITAAAHMFIDAHAQSLAIESRLVLAQSALEGLADGWPFSALPGAPAIPPPPPKKPPPAWHNLSRIAVSLGVPLSVPASLPHLAALASPAAAATALEKVTWIRNSIAHLNNVHRVAGVSSRAKHEALRFASWLLELALLRYLDASGEYLNRLTARSHGEVEALPWLPQPAPVPPAARGPVASST